MRASDEMSATERRTQGLSIASRTGGQISKGLDPELLLESDKEVSLAKTQLKKVSDKIEIAEKEIPAMQELKQIIQNISNSISPLSVYSSGHGLEHEDVNLFDDYSISTTSQDMEKDASHYVEVSRIKDDGSYSRFSGSERAHSLHITQLAKSDTYEFNKRFSSATDALGFDGTLKLNGVAITVTASQDLNTIIRNVNNAKTGVTLGKITFANGSCRVTMKATESGLSNALGLTDTSLFFDEVVDGEGNRLFDGLANNLDSVTTKTTEAQDAIIEIDDSSPVSYPSNKIKNAISGMEFDLLNANSEAGKKITIKLSANIDEVTEAIINYAASTNKLNRFVKLHTNRTSAGEFSKGADLEKQRTFIQAIYRQVRDAVDSQSIGIDNGLTALSQLGFVYNETEERSEGEGDDKIVIPKFNEFKLRDSDSVRKIVKEQYDEVRKVFQFCFESSHSALSLLSHKNKMIDAGILKFSLVINKDNLSGNDPVTGLPLDTSKQAVITYTKLTGEVVTVYPPKVEMTGSSASNMEVIFPSQFSKDEIEGYDAKPHPLEGLGLLYENVPSGNVVVDVDMSQGSGNKTLSILKEMLSSKASGGMLETKISELKEEKLRLKEDEGRHQEELDKKTAAAQQKLQKQQAAISAAENSITTLQALRDADNSRDK